MTASDVALFAAGGLGRRDLRRFLQQAATTCALCRMKLRFYLPPGETCPERHIALWREERDGLARLQDRQGSAPFDGSYSRFRHVARKVHGWARVEHLLELSSELRFRDPKQMLLLAQGAASVANNLGALPTDQGRYTPALKADLRARAQIELANAYRLNYDFAHAEACLGAAAELAERGHCAPRTVGELMAIYAALLMDQRRIGSVFKLLDKLRRHYLAFGETHLAGITLIKKGTALHREDRHEEATEALREGIASLTAERDPELLSRMRQPLIVAAVAAGNFREAGKLLMDRSLWRTSAAAPLFLLKLRWVEGRYFAGIGEFGHAEASLIEVKKELLRHDRKNLMAMLNLDLAEVLLRQGRKADVRPLAEDSLRLFRDLKYERETLKAVCLLGAAG